jgi:hypothetical protein
MLKDSKNSRSGLHDDIAATVQCNYLCRDIEYAANPSLLSENGKMWYVTTNMCVTRSRKRWGVQCSITSRTNALRRIYGDCAGSTAFRNAQSLRRLPLFLVLVAQLLNVHTVLSPYQNCYVVDWAYVRHVFKLYIFMSFSVTAASKRWMGVLVFMDNSTTLYQLYRLYSAEW